VMFRTRTVLLWLLGPLCGCLAFGTNIGPDSFGYTASNTSQTFHFIEIAGTGTQILANDDESSVFSNIGFTFNFYGTPYNGLFVNSNGLITFGTPYNGISSQPISLATEAPSGNMPMIAVLWDDWTTFKSDAPNSDAVYTETLGSPGSRLFVVEWHNTYPFFPPGNTGLTFEVVLMEGSDNILMQYKNVVGGTGLQSLPGYGGDNGSSAGVGIRDTSGQSNGRNVQWSFDPDTAVISNGEAILFGTPEPSTLSLLVLGALVLIPLRRRIGQGFPARVGRD